jgi:SpoVK/Ycf46/Vps4 family AAA+-type ATPase
MSLNKLAQMFPQPVSEKPEELVRTFTNWLKDKNTYAPVGDVSVEEEFQKSAYKIRPTMTGLVFDRIKPKTAELYKFRSGPMEEVLSEIDRFWDLESEYKKLGILHNRGILLYGPPGSGKSSIIAQTVDMITGRGDVVIYCDDMSYLKGGLLAFRSVEPKRKVVVVIEDADDHLRYNEQAFLHLLDGQDSIENILYLATTNYIERFPERMLRSGRFDKKVHVPQPPREGRLVYLKNKLKPSKMETDKEIERLADETDGMSFGDLLELVTAVYALKEPVEKVLSRLKKEPEEKESDPGEMIVQLKAAEESLGYIAPLDTVKKVYRGGSSLGSGINFDQLKQAMGK